MKDLQKLENLFNEINKKGLITESEIKKVKRLTDITKSNIFTYSSEMELKLTKEQTEKAKRWLISLYKTPSGKEKANPELYGREEHVVEGLNFEIFFMGIHEEFIYRDVSYLVPVYLVSSDNGTFEYHINLDNRCKHKISIID